MVAADEHRLVLNGAVSQLDRARQAPAPEQVPVNGRELPELVGFAAAYGRLIQFYDLEDNKDGDWSAFFLADPSVGLAVESGFDVAAIEARVETQLDALRSAQGMQDRMQAAQRVIALIARLLRELTGQAAVAETIEAALGHAIESRRHPELASPARRLLLHLRSSPLEAALRRDAREVAEAWFQLFAALLEELAAVLLAALTGRRDAAAAGLAQSLQARGHPPQGALWDAFCVLYGHARQTLNQFPVRLIRFYQDAILRQASRTAGPDQVHLSLTPSGDAPVTVPPGSTVPAGTDASGTPVGYTIDQAATVSACSVSALRTLQVVSGPLVADATTPVSEQGVPRQGVPQQGVPRQGGPARVEPEQAVPQLVLSGVVTLAASPPVIAAPFPLFGAAAPGVYGSLTTWPASLGFAIASPTLMLTGGVRAVAISLALSPESMSALAPLLSTISQAAGGIDAFSLLAQIMQAGLALSYSTADGWVSVVGFTVTPPPAPSPPASFPPASFPPAPSPPASSPASAPAATPEGTPGGTSGGTSGGAPGPAPAETPPDLAVFTLGFTLDADAAPFVGFSTPPAGVVPDATQPTLLAALVQAAVLVGPPGAQLSVCPYSLLSLVSLLSVTIGVTVTGLAALTVANPAGKVDASQPFAVFGSPPVQMAALTVSAAELWVKPVGGLTLTIGWSGLPVTSNGFYGYYFAYVVNPDGQPVLPGSQFDNPTFQVALEVADPGLWTIPPPATDAPPLYLFRSGDGVSPPAPQAPLAAVTAWTMSTQPTAPPSYYDASKSALQLTLSNPAYAFGDMLYAPSVMAASVRLTAAASACAQRCGQGGTQGGGQGGSTTSANGHAAASHLAPVLQAIETATDHALPEALRTAVRSALSNLNGMALTLVRDAIAASGAAEATVRQWLAGLTTALARPPPRALFGDRPQAALHQHPSGTVLANLQSWLQSFGASLGTHVQGKVADAQKLLAAGESVAVAHAQAARQSPAVARPTMAVATRDAQAKLLDGATAPTPPTTTPPTTTPPATTPADGSADVQKCIQDCMAGANAIGFPNQPFVPMAASITLDYTATSVIPPTGTATTGAATPDRFFHLLPFDACAPVAWTAGNVVLLLAPVAPSGALLVTLTNPATDLSLLFHLAQPTGGWPRTTPDVAWEQQTGSGWATLSPLRDTTGNLAHSGLVGLPLTLDADATEALLRISVTRSADVFPLLATLAPNAVTARWTGPGGAADRGTPLPARTITAAGPSLPQLGPVEQPMASFGGQPPAPDAAYEMWLAERLRHKGFAVQAWDYARLLLDAFPLLWQVAVVPASDHDGAPPPGQVWVVPVPGPQTPNVANPAQPVSDGATLAAIEAMLRGRISPFIVPLVTNPPYLPIKVTAKLVFTRADAAGACADRLNSELIAFLSPWPPSAELGPRPADYYTERGVTQFIRRRPYVQAILSIALAPDPPADIIGWRYVTSAAAHDICGKAAP